MARGGYISAKKVLEKVYTISKSGQIARSRILEALCFGHISAKGIPVQSWEWNDTFRVDRLRFSRKNGKPDFIIKKRVRLLKAAKSLHAEVVRTRGANQLIPVSFWEQMTIRNRNDSIWSDGTFYSENKENGTIIEFEEVKFSEKDINFFLSKLTDLSLPQASHLIQEKKERRRSSDWDEWIAAIVSLSFEHAFTSDTRRQDLLNLITLRLQRWGLEERPETTVGPSATKVLERLRADPPAMPIALLPTQTGHGKP